MARATAAPRRARTAAADAAGRPGWLVALALLPLAVSALALVYAVGGRYLPTGDQAGTEIAVRSLGHHEVLTGLWSHEHWSHPGPLSFYLLAPAYWLAGRESIGLNVGALAINAAAIAGMAAVAWRRGGRPLLLCTLVACALVVRTLGPELVHDSSNLNIVVLPYGLLFFLAWAMACREAWALPVGALVASYLAQTHIGFLVLALPLAALGAAWLVVGTLRAEGDDRAPARRSLRTAALATAAVLALVWAPPAVDVLLHSPNNARLTYEWFKAGDEGVHSLGDGWTVVTGQFGLPPEWLTSRLAAPQGVSPFLRDPALPVLFVPVAAALVFLARRRADGRALAVVLGATLALGVVAVARTVGPILNYRLLWTWMPPLLAFVAVAWAVWLAAVDRWGARAERVLTVAATAVLVAVTAVNVVTAAGAGTPHPDDSALVRDVMPPITASLDPAAGAVVVSDPWTPGSWYGRAVVLQLERRGFDARVPADKAAQFTRHLAADPGPVQARLLVFRDGSGAALNRVPGVRHLARAAFDGGAQDRLERRIDRILSDDSLTPAQVYAAVARLKPLRAARGQMFATSLDVYLDTRPVSAGGGTVPWPAPKPVTPG
jgi:hypothetical protein